MSKVRIYQYAESNFGGLNYLISRFVRVKCLCAMFLNLYFTIFPCANGLAEFNNELGAFIISILYVLMQHIPAKFSNKYLLNKKTKMTLTNKNGNSWEVNVIPYRHSAFFSAGWSYFLKDNALKQGDVCIFELVKETEMQVHIFRSSVASRNRLKI